MNSARSQRPGWPLARVLAVAVALILVIASVVSAWLFASVSAIKPAPYEYNVAGWELRSFANKWLYEIGSLFHDEATEAEQDEALLRFFVLTRDIGALEERLSDVTQRGETVSRADEEELERLIGEREEIENLVEATIEGRITWTAARLDLTRSLLIDDVVWPPVDLEFTQAPRSLATSRRDRIELLETTLLRADLSLAEVEAIEEETAAKKDVAALAFRTAGIGAYPTIVEYGTEYRGMLELAAHEWIHNYLFFRPLGFGYYRNNDLRSMNETVADLAGREIAAAVMTRWPLEEPVRPQAAPSPAPGVDVGAVLRQLRQEVDALLAAGRLDEAEALMEQRRVELAGQGVRFRKLNQAYFAFVNLYAGEAGNPAATNPIGPKIDELRRRSESLSAFIERIGGFTSVRQLDEALSAPAAGGE